MTDYFNYLIMKTYGHQDSWIFTRRIILVKNIILSYLRIRHYKTRENMINEKLPFVPPVPYHIFTSAYLCNWTITYLQDSLFHKKVCSKILIICNDNGSSGVPKPGYKARYTFWPPHLIYSLSLMFKLSLSMKRSLVKELIWCQLSRLTYLLEIVVHSTVDLPIYPYNIGPKSDVALLPQLGKCG